MRVIHDRLAPLVSYMEDETVNEIMINNSDNIFVESKGRMERINVTLDDLAVATVIDSIMSINSKDVAYIMDARLPGLRIACAMPPVAIHGPMIVIRKHARNRFKLDDYVSAGAFNRKPKSDRKIDDDKAKVMEVMASNGGEDLAEFVRWAVKAKKNVLLVGGTSSGKTTLLSTCLLEVPFDERIITCEDTNEIVLEQPNIIQLEAFLQPGAAPITIRHLIKLCLRSRPDRIVVGELRGEEAYDFVDAMNTGHPGSLCTLHADSAFLGLSRLESLIRMSPSANNLPLVDMRADIARAIDYVIFQSRADGTRGPEQVIALDGVGPDGKYQWRSIFEKFY